jgi:hypothetical protein
MHILEKSPDFDQVLHVRLDTSTCVFVGNDTLADLVVDSATFVVPNSINTVIRRLTASGAIVEVQLYTLRNQQSSRKSYCSAVVLEEVHCVVVPDSFTKCPAINHN